MTNYKYNELVYVQNIYRKGFDSKYIPSQLRLLVLYFRDELKLKPKEREKALYGFCVKYISGFKKEKHFKSINKALRNGFKKEQKLIVVKNIKITKSELSYINNLDIDYNYKKIMLAFLAQMKLNKEVYKIKYEKDDYDCIYFKGINKKYNSIKNMANIPTKISINDDAINELNRLGYVKILHNGAIKLDYIKNISEDDNIALIITDYENIGLYLDLYNNINGVVTCENCGKPIKKNKNIQKYCKDCAREIQFEQKKEWDRTRRNR